MSRDRWTSGDLSRSSGWPRSAAGPAAAGAAASSGGAAEGTEKASQHKGAKDESFLHEEDLVAGGPSRPGGDPAAVGDDQRAEIEQLRHERDEYLDSLQRLQAEFANFRKRMMREQTAQVERASQSIIASLLPVLDAADLALAHAGRGDADADGEALAQVSRLLNDTLVKEGLERIDAEGVRFDPDIHDAVAHEPKEDAGGGAATASPGEDDGAAADATAAGSPSAPAVGGSVAPDNGGGGSVEGGAVVADVLRAGYRLKGRTLRPAMVKVRG